MANIEQNRKLMVENMKKVKAQLSEDKDKALSDLLQMASDGSLSPDDIRDINKQLLSARRKGLASKVSPETRSSAAEKGKQTKALNIELKNLRNKLSDKFDISTGERMKILLQNPLSRETEKKSQQAQKYWNSKIYPMLKKKYPLADEYLYKNMF